MSPLSLPGRRTYPLVRRVARVVVIGGGAIAAASIAAIIWLLRDQTRHFETRRSQLGAIVADTAIDPGGDRIEMVRLTASSGLVVELAVRHPVGAAPNASDNGKRPLVVLLGGHRTGRNAVKLVGDTRGVIVAALSYPFAGNHRAKGLDVLKQVPLIRGAVLDTPPAIMLALDYLLALRDVDPSRIELVGVSLGAPFAAIVGALDERVSRVWVVHGSGGVYVPLEHNLRRPLGGRAASIPVAGLATIALSGSQLGAERWAPRIAPRAFVMINARDDERVPRAAIDQLFESAGEPKEMIWTTGGHVRSEAEAVRPLVELVLGRIVGDAVAPLVAGSASQN
jgi:hypothetical protein